MSDNKQTLGTEVRRPDPSFTPAPWVVNICEGDDVVEVCADDEDPPLADCRTTWNCRTITEQIANAHLIAAAPDMYEALSDIMAAWNEPVYGDNNLRLEFMYQAIEKHRLVLTKAKGGA